LAGLIVLNPFDFEGSNRFTLSGPSYGYYDLIADRVDVGFGAAGIELPLTPTNTLGGLVYWITLLVSSYDFVGNN
jgi:hypothetical protein